MKTHNSIAKALLPTLCVAAVVVLYFLAAPTQIGGPASLVMTKGRSMEPGIHEGDLVVTRRAASYRAGDAVAYRDPKMDIVLHRIVAVERGLADGDRFVMQGDNNSWLDPYQPRPDEVVGKMWLHLPRAGKLLEVARKPQNFAVLCGVLGVMAMGTFGGIETKKRRGRRGGRDNGSSGPNSGQNQPRQQKDDASPAISARDALLLMACGVLAVAALLAVLGFRKPVTRAAAKNVSYEQSATFSYTAATRSGVYDTAAAQTGDPVFIRLSEAVEVSILYRFAAAEPHAVAGSYRVVARITGENGWRRTLPLTPKTEFTGDGFKAQVPLQIADLQYTIATTEHETGVTGRTYKVAIVPEVELAGTLAGQELKERFSPALTFAMDPLQLTVERAPEGPRATGAGATVAAADPFKPSQKGMVQRPGTKPNTLSILFITLKVQTARTLALAGTALAVLLGGVAGWLTLQARRADEPARIQSRYAPLMLKLAEGDPAGAGTRVVRVASIDDLVKVAGQEGRMILHKNGGLAHRYFVADGELVYEYATQSRPPVAAAVNGTARHTGDDQPEQDSGNGAGRGA